MKLSTGTSAMSQAGGKITTAEAFYRVFCALPKKERLNVARYIFQNDEIRRSLELSETPNDLTLSAFNEDISKTPVFESVSSLRKDLLA